MLWGLDKNCATAELLVRHTRVIYVTEERTQYATAYFHHDTDSSQQRKFPVFLLFLVALLLTYSLLLLVLQLHTGHPRVIQFSPDLAERTAIYTRHR